MTFTNNLKHKYDLPVWESLRFLQTATSATSALTYSDSLDNRYIYYLSGSVFYRYDTITDGYQLLQSPNIAPVTAVSLRYTAFGGYRGNVLDSTSNTLTIAGMGQGTLVGQKIRITAGTGVGQERSITAVTDNIVLDHGVITATTASSLSDSTKKWKPNQWVGYQVRLVFNTGQSQIRKILYNDNTALTIQDNNYQQLECWNNTAFSATAPYAVPVVTAGSQAHYTIENNIITLDTAWDIQPDDSSSYVIMSGGVWLFSSAAAAPWSSLQYYDVMSDTWTTKTAMGGLLLAAYGTDLTIERLGEVAGVFTSGTATSGGERTLTDSTKIMEIDRYCNYQIRIVSGTGAGQKSRIVANGTNYFEIPKPWDVVPDNTSVYNIYGDTDKLVAAGGGASALYKYNVEADIWYQGPLVDYGIARNAALQYKGQEAFGITTAARTTSGITAVNAVPTAGGTGYAVGDICTVSTGGTLGKVRVTAVSAGVVTGIELHACGSGYTIGTGKATTNVIGAGSGLTVEITTIGTVGKITTATNHNILQGDAVTVSGITEAFWNGTYTTTLAADSLTTVEFITTATAAGVITSTQSTTVLVDSTKNWTVNEHVGKIVSINTAGTAPTTQIRRITANTAKTLTLQSAITAAVNGTSRYSIYSPECFARDEQHKVIERGNNGRATGGSTSTLVDSTKNWFSNQWLGYKFRIVAGTGVGNEIQVTSNTSNTLTYSTQTFTPDSTTKYLIMDTFGLATAGATTSLTDSTKVWTVNQWAGKRCRITSGTGAGQEFTITSNTVNQLTFTAITTAPSTDSTYTILSAPVRGTSIEAIWAFGNSDPSTKGKYIYLSRGGASNVLDRYDITKDLYEFTLVITPQTESLTTGTMWCYDAADSIYCHVAGTGRIGRVDLKTGQISGNCQVPYAHGTAVIGNRMEVIKTEEGLYYLYIARHTGQELFRTLIFW